MTKIVLSLIAVSLSFAFSACSTTRATQQCGANASACCSASVKKSGGDSKKACCADKKTKKSGSCH